MKKVVYISAVIIFFAWFIFLCFSCSHKGVVIKQPVATPVPARILLTIKERSTTIQDFNGEFYRLYTLSNDSVLWLPQFNRFYPGDTIYLPFKNGIAK